MSSHAGNLTSKLEALQEQYRQQSLEDRLEAVAEDLRDIKLQLAIMNDLFGTDVTIDNELVELVQETRADAEANRYDALAEKVDKLEQQADDERAAIEQSLNQQLVSYHNQVNAMLRLNEELDAYNQESLKALKVLLDKWNWKAAASIEDLSDFEAQLSECRAFGQDMHQIYAEAQTAIIEPLITDPIEETVTRLLESETVYLGELTPEKQEALMDSELADYIGISLK